MVTLGGFEEGVRVEGRGVQTKMPRAALPRSGESGDAIIMLVALGVSFLFVVVQIGFTVTAVPILLDLHERAGLGLPSMLSLAQALGPFGILATLSIFDIAVFTLCALLARRYWIGLLFVPPAIYLATIFALFIGFLGGSAATALVG